MSTEVELKLSLDPADLGRLRGAAALAAAKPKTKVLDALYLDTRDQEVSRNGMALRIRSSAGRWSQCLKAGAHSTGGLHSRSEWEIDRPGPEMDLALFRETPLAELASAETLHERLEIAFRVTVERTAWIIEPGAGTRLEVALDVGEIRRGKRAEPVCEVEIECTAGDAMHVFDLAMKLNDAAVLRPSATSKAQRGYRLVRSRPPRPLRAAPAKVSFDMRPAEAAAAILRAGLEQLQGNEEGVLESDDPEFVHQARTALRRMRSALRMFRRAIGADRANVWREELSQAARALGDARDWDVFVAGTLPAILKSYGKDSRALRERATVRRLQARAGAREGLRSPGYARAILEISKWLAQPADAADDETLDEFAARVLSKRHARLVAGLERLPHADMGQRHRVRIDAKRLRYVVEGLAPAMDAVAARRYAQNLSRLQDVLGSANDAVAGERLLLGLKPSQQLAAFAKHWLAGRIRGETGKIARVADAITGARAFWRDH